ncbi:cell wall anchor protein, partial [Bacillus cereus]
MMGTKKTVAISTLALAMIAGADTSYAETPDVANIHDSIKQHAEEREAELKQAKQNVEEKVAEAKQHREEREAELKQAK